MKNKITAIVLTFNEERQIRDCLESIKWVDEIVVIDSFSTDRTVEICKEYTDKIYQREYQRYAYTRNWALQFGSFDWILVVDADERYTLKLAREIKERLERSIDTNGYYIPMNQFCFGKEMKYWRREEKRIKLFRKNFGYWEEREVHPRIIVKGKKDHLKNPLLHYAYPNLKAFFEKYKRYISWEADEMRKCNKNLKTYYLFETILRVPLNFYNIFILNKTFLDGWRGLFISFFTSIYDFLSESTYYFRR